MNDQFVTFQNALDSVETLPDEQQGNLIDIVQHRLFDRRRREIADNIKTARDEYARGDTKRGPVEDLMKELSE